MDLTPVHRACSLPSILHGFGFSCVKPCAPVRIFIGQNSRDLLLIAASTCSALLELLLRSCTCGGAKGVEYAKRAYPTCMQYDITLALIIFYVQCNGCMLKLLFVMQNCLSGNRRSCEPSPGKPPGSLSEIHRMRLFLRKCYVAGTQDPN